MAHRFVSFSTLIFILQLTVLAGVSAAYIGGHLRLAKPFRVSVMTGKESIVSHAVS